MNIKLQFALPYDQMEPAYDMEFQPNYMAFRTYTKLRATDQPGESHFLVRDDCVVFCTDVAVPEYTYEVQISRASFERLTRLYRNGRD